jgi:cation transport protein ChaC
VAVGTNAQYLFSLDDELTRLGMKDDCLNELVVKVKALLEGTRSTARCDRVCLRIRPARRAFNVMLLRS